MKLLLVFKGQIWGMNSLHTEGRAESSRPGLLQAAYRLDKCMDTKVGREGGMNWEIGIDIYTLL